jgi:hypothetical protein
MRNKFLNYIEKKGLGPEQREVNDNPLNVNRM